MVWKNYLLKKRTKGQLIFEFLVPILIVIYIKLVLPSECQSENGQECSEEQAELQARIRSISNPLVMALVVPSIFSVGQRFILQGMVEDKVNKMRDSLRMMSLSRISYTMSIFLI